MRISDWSSDVCSSDVCGDGSSGLEGIGLAAKAIAIFYRNRIARVVRAVCAGRAAGRSRGGSGRGLAELLAQPVVAQALLGAQLVDRQSGGSGKGVYVRVDLGGRRSKNKKNNKN